MADPVSIQNWVFNAVSAFLIIEGVISVVNLVYEKDKKTPTQQARIWIRSILMIIAAIVIFWLIHSSETSVRVRSTNVRSMNNRSNFNNI